jgi:A/G-specific adenine glycosylase
VVKPRVPPAPPLAAPTTPTAPDSRPALAPGLRDAILGWFDAVGRPLAFRATADPWAILVSEAMAQQTQASRAADHWTRFLAQFPTAGALAAASPAAALRAWRGLGYNRRALALRSAAIVIVRDHDGIVPDDLEALRRLPGVGPYTARAVAALAFGRPVGAVDVNVRRVLARVLAGSRDSLGSSELQAIADAAVPAEAPGTWTHALMDVGATLCRPRGPRCGDCPAAPWCLYRRSGGTLEVAPRPRTRAGGAGPAAAAHGAAERPAAFRTTSRWLRGRILDHLRDTPDGGWASVPRELGTHDGSAVDRALGALARDGLAERHPEDPSKARLPIA